MSPLTPHWPRQKTGNDFLLEESGPNPLQQQQQQQYKTRQDKTRQDKTRQDKRVAVTIIYSGEASGALKSLHLNSVAIQ
jgi:hypothetical protein